MNRIISFWSFAVIMALCVSCGGGNKAANTTENAGNDKVVGKWQLDKSTMSLEDLQENEECAFDGWMEIKEDGTAIDFDACKNQNSEHQATWKKEGDQYLLTVTAGGESIVFILETSADDKLVMSLELFGEKISQAFVRMR